MKKIITLLFSIMACLQPANSQIMIDPSQTYQVIEGFSASDCWTGNYVGKYWDENTKEQIAKYLFSKNLTLNGSPEGIGLSMWRFNLGAGTAEQGDASDITDISRRAECFLNETGTSYDWSKQAGQQWFLKKAKAYGCESFVAFSNAPPVYYSRNGKGYANGDGNANLQDDKYDDFANYMTTVINHFKEEEGIVFRYISPVNEPQYDWKESGQEGSPWQNEEIKKLTVELDKSIVEKRLETKILLSEAGAWDYLYTPKGRASNQVVQFFDQGSNNYIADLPSLAPIIGGHSYWTHDHNFQLKDTRVHVSRVAKEYKLNVFQTEWSMLSAGEGFPGYDTATYMDIALFMAKMIHSDLAFAEVTSWSYWTSMDMERWGHKNRFLLLALAPGGDFYNPVTQPGAVYDRSTLWALGNYSYFIRPGYQRIQLQGADDLAGLMGTAYIAPDQSKVVAVYVNMASEEKKITTGFQNMQELTPVKNKIYVTNSSYNLRKTSSSTTEIYDPNKEIIIPSRSVVTLVYELQSKTSISSLKADRLHIYPNPVLTAGDVMVELPEPVNGKWGLSIYSLQGKLLYSENEKATAGVESVSVSLPNSLHEGVYLLKIQSGRTVYQGKLFIRSR